VDISIERVVYFEYHSDTDISTTMQRTCVIEMMVKIMWRRIVWQKSTDVFDIPTAFIFSVQMCLPTLRP
jgi:hypothetical protein